MVFGPQSRKREAQVSNAFGASCNVFTVPIVQFHPPAIIQHQGERDAEHLTESPMFQQDPHCFDSPPCPSWPQSYLLLSGKQTVSSCLLKFQLSRFWLLVFRAKHFRVCKKCKASAFKINFYTRQLDSAEIPWTPWFWLYPSAP